MKLSIVAAVLLSLPLTTTAQFACTLSGATDEDSCFAATDDGGDSCVWCALSQFGFCVAEAQAEAMEKLLPSIQCDRTPKPDPSTDDKAPPTPTDDKITPSDDKIPSNYWECLEQKDSTTCAAKEGCTWCKTKAGFGLCLTGPSAESASDSSWFDCKAVDDLLLEQQEDAPQDPMDTTCVMAFLQDPTEDGCKAAVDSDGGACLWCDLAGMTSLCLTAEQAQMAQIIGVTCEEASVKISLRGA